VLLNCGVLEETGMELERELDFLFRLHHFFFDCPEDWSLLDVTEAGRSIRLRVLLSAGGGPINSLEESVVDRVVFVVTDTSVKVALGDLA
jgi:predicted TIM-barrel enzyme